MYQLPYNTDNISSNFSPTIQPDWENQRVPIGTPTCGTSVYVLNDDLQLVAFGDVGEICIGGVGVSCGYIQECENAKPFIHCFQTEEVYRTGDLGFYLPDGNIQFVSRKDRQVVLYHSDI